MLQNFKSNYYMPTFVYFWPLWTMSINTCLGFLETILASRKSKIIINHNQCLAIGIWYWNFNSQFSLLCIWRTGSFFRYLLGSSWRHTNITVRLFLIKGAFFQCCGSGSEIRDEQPGSYFLELRNHFFGFLGLKYVNSLMRIRDPGWRQFESGMEKSRIRDPG